MKNETNNPDITKSKALLIYENALLIFYLGVIILRVIYTESPTMQTNAITAASGDSLYNLYVSAGLLFSFIVWFVWSLFEKKFLFRITGIEIGLIIFAIAAVISGFAASDKRLAINNIVSLFTSILCAILLVQILDSSAKIKLVLAVIAALGVMSAYQCADQLLFSNRETVQEYEKNPENMLEPLNIQPGTLQSFLFEQRLHSNNARAFFTTRNSAASFLLMAFFAAASLVAVSEKPVRLKIIFYILLITVFLTKSKGAIIGLFFTFVLIMLYCKYASFLKIHRKLILISIILIIAAGTLIIAWYGQTYNTLPGGNSMLVRWQYWHASAKMFMDHFWTGAGPGNFGNYYSYYKPAEAIESVIDPHNFPLSILTQYGIFGLIGFLAMIFSPLWTITKSNPVVSPLSDSIKTKPAENQKFTLIILSIWIALLLARLTILPTLRTGNLLVVLYIIIMYFTPPAAVFILSLFFIKKYAYSIPDNEQEIKRNQTVSVFLFCMIPGVLLHNLTDYAIFEPGIYTTFWFILAVLIALNIKKRNENKIIFNTMLYSKISAILISIIVLAVFLQYALIPAAASTKKINLANKAFAYGHFEQAYTLLDSAAEYDKLSSYALTLSAHMYMENAEISPSRSQDMRRVAYKCLQEAIKRNPASFKNYEDLSKVYLRLSETSNPEEKNGWLELALSAATEAIKRYEGNERLHFNLAQIAEKLADTQTALKEYQKSVEIENSYRNMFHKMYPKDEIVSRLGNDKYEYAIKRIAELTSQNEI
jgi:tetratricopeptide (TPR) repeat protein